MQNISNADRIRWVIHGLRWPHVSMPMADELDTILEMIDWLEDAPGSEFIMDLEGNRLFFRREEDLVLFKMIWM